MRDRLADDRGNMPMVLLIILVGMALSAVLLPTLIVQDRATTFDATRIDNLAAAQAGVDVVTGQIRAATVNGSGSIGDATKLPCAPAENSVTGQPAAPIAGTVSSPGKAQYSVTIAYYLTDPSAGSATPTQMLCVPRDGTYLAVGGTEHVVPSYARITSVGTDGVTAATGGSRARTITTTYMFNTTDNLPSGRIVLSGGGSSPSCLDATASPQPSQGLVLRPCTSPASAQQLFAYRSDLTLQLPSSITTTTPYGLCVDFQATTGASAPAANLAVLLTACQPLGSPLYSQQWSYNNTGGFTAALQTSATTAPTNSTSDNNLSTLCMAAATQTVGTPVLLQTCDNNPSSPQQTWQPDPTVGDGASAPPPATNFQLVNYLQFGRCLDVSNATPNNPLISYPCKQNPYPNAVRWNQRWNFDPSTGWLSTNDTDNGTQYCAYPVTDGSQVLLTPCASPGTGIVPSQLVWRRGVATTSAARPNLHTYVDSSNANPAASRCLGISSSSGAVVVTACANKTLDQEWGDPSSVPPGYENTVEQPSPSP